MKRPERPKCGKLWDIEFIDRFWAVSNMGTKFEVRVIKRFSDPDRPLGDIIDVGTKQRRERLWEKQVHFNKRGFIEAPERDLWEEGLESARIAHHRPGLMVVKSAAQEERERDHQAQEERQLKRRRIANGEIEPDHVQLGAADPALRRQQGVLSRFLARPAATDRSLAGSSRGRPVILDSDDEEGSEGRNVEEEEEEEEEERKKSVEAEGDEEDKDEEEADGFEVDGEEETPNNGRVSIREWETPSQLERFVAEAEADPYRGDRPDDVTSSQLARFVDEADADPF